MWQFIARLVGNPICHVRRTSEQLPPSRISAQTMQNENTKTDLLAFTLPQLQQWLVERGEAAFRAKQIFGWLYRQLVTDFAAMTNLSASLRQRLAEEACIGPMIVRSELHSK